MPVAGGHIGAGVKYHYEDHDTDGVNEIPPVQNTWYEVFDAEDVRLIWCTMRQTNDEAAAKDVELRWTIDGNVYFLVESLADSEVRWCYRSVAESSGGTGGLISQIDKVNAAYNVDKRGQSFKVEIRLTGAPGTNQTLRCRCVRETLEAT